nr:uncharacterized protein LOC112584308 [Bubalus bubalis]
MPYAQRLPLSRAQLLTARCPLARWTQQRSLRGLQPCVRRHARQGSGAETTPDDGRPHPATGDGAKQARPRRKGTTADEAPPPARDFRRASAFGARAPPGARGRLRARARVCVVIDACALTSSWAGGPWCRPVASRDSAPRPWRAVRGGSTCKIRRRVPEGCCERGSRRGAGNVWVCRPTWCTTWSTFCKRPLRKARRSLKQRQDMSPKLPSGTWL